MDAIKALASEPRYQIMQWMRDPERNFPPPLSGDKTERRPGVCVGQVARKLDMTQSTASLYLSILHRAGLLESERCGKFTYYRRNDEALKELCAIIGNEV